MGFGFDFGKSKNKSESRLSTSEWSLTNAPEWWREGTSDVFTDTGYLQDTYGMGNVSPLQQEGIDSLTRISRENNASNFLGGSVNPALGRVADRFVEMSEMPNYSLSGPTPTVGTDAVTSASAFDMAQPYRDAYGMDVYDAAMADFDEGTKRAANAFRAGAIGGGAQGAGSQPVAAGVLAADAARNRGALSAGVRADILDRSFGFGGTDANRKLSADATTAGNKLQASMANANLQQQRDLANLEASIASDANRSRALENVATLVQQQGENALTGETQESRNAINMLTAAGIPVEQALAIIKARIGALNAAVPGFGNETQRRGETSGTSSGSTFGFNFEE